MRKTRISLPVLAGVILAFSLAWTGFAFQNEPEGLRSLKWGDEPTANMVSTNCVNEREDSWNDCFYLPDNKLAIGGGPLTQIVYSFYYSEPPRLMSVTLLFKEKENYDLLKTICEEIFGKATKSTMPFFAWKDLWIGRRTTTELSFKVIGDGYLKFFSPQILAEKKKTDEAKEIEEAKGDF